MAAREFVTEAGYVNTDDAQREYVVDELYFVDQEGTPPPASTVPVRLIGGVLTRSPLLKSRFVGEL